MLSSKTYKILVEYADQRSYSKLELAEAIRLFCSDFKNIDDSPDNKLTKAAIGTSLTSKTNLGHIFESAKTNVKVNAEGLMAPEMRKASIRDGFHSVFWNIVSNVLFIILSIIIYFVIRATAEDFLSNVTTSQSPEISELSEKSESVDPKSSVIDIDVEDGNSKKAEVP